MKSLGRLAGAVAGLPVIEWAGCDETFGSGSGANNRKWLGHYVGELIGLPVYEVAECLDGAGSANAGAIGRALGHYAGELVGLPVYERVCCGPLGSGSFIFSHPCCPGKPLPAVLYATFTWVSGACTCLNGATIPLVWGTSPYTAPFISMWWGIVDVPGCGTAFGKPCALATHFSIGCDAPPENFTAFLDNTPLSAAGNFKFTNLIAIDFSCDGPIDITFTSVLVSPIANFVCCTGSNFVYTVHVTE